MSIYLKALGPNRECINGGKGSWPEPGVWTEPIRPVDGLQGWHVCTPEGMLADWLPDTRNTLWQVEILGAAVTARNKQAVEQARVVRQLDWSDRTARLFAADCAEAALEILTTRPVRLPAWMIRRREHRRRLNGIEAARRAAYGEIGRRELAEVYGRLCSPSRAYRGRRGDPVWSHTTDALYTNLLASLRSPRRTATHCAAIACTPTASGQVIARLAYRAALAAGVDGDELVRLFLRNIRPTAETSESMVPVAEISHPTIPNLEVERCARS